MRGTACLPAGKARRSRFIPAHAGNRLNCPRRNSRQPVHPRACGEQPTSTASRACPGGSSPRMRGTADAAEPVVPLCRFIPAHAGNRPCIIATRGRFPVHPRACGEQPRGICSSRSPGGSSPRMRGTGLCGFRGRGGRRFIPAHAGNRRSRSIWAIAWPVHPRACGEQMPENKKLSPEAGSSPRMRGTAGERQGGARQRRFIPAHAGNSQPLGARRDQAAVHPRACGEQSSTQ